MEKKIKISRNWNQSQKNSYEYLKSTCLFVYLAVGECNDVRLDFKPFVVMKEFDGIYEGFRLFPEPIQCSNELDNRGYYYAIDLSNSISRIRKNEMVSDPNSVLISNDLDEIVEIFLNKFNLNYEQN